MDKVIGLLRVRNYMKRISVPRFCGDKFTPEKAGAGMTVRKWRLAYIGGF